MHGGRFNARGVAIVYTAATVSLASLEMLVHLQSREILGAYTLRSVTFDAALVRRIRLSDLPRNWRDNPVPAAVQRVGTDWVVSGDSAVLEVPSAVVPAESNFLLNVLHPDFAKIRFGKASRHKVDPRLA